MFDSQQACLKNAITSFSILMLIEVLCLRKVSLMKWHAKPSNVHFYLSVPHIYTDITCCQIEALKRKSKLPFLGFHFCRKCSLSCLFENRTDVYFVLLMHSIPSSKPRIKVQSKSLLPGILPEVPNSCWLEMFWLSHTNFDIHLQALSTTRPPIVVS